MASGNLQWAAPKPLKLDWNKLDAHTFFYALERKAEKFTRL
jgi:hypothetical protein